MDWTGLDCTGLHWTAWDWAGLDWIVSKVFRKILAMHGGATKSDQNQIWNLGKRLLGNEFYPK